MNIEIFNELTHPNKGLLFQTGFQKKKITTCVLVKKKLKNKHNTYFFKRILKRNGGTQFETSFANIQDKHFSNRLHNIIVIIFRIITH